MSTITVRPRLHGPRLETPYAWVNVLRAAPFAPRDGAGALCFAGRMWLVGGWNNADRRNFPLDCVNDVWSSADGRSWRLEKPNSFGLPSFDPEHDWEGRHTAGYAVHDGKMWIVGGDSIQKHYQNDVWCSVDGVHWEDVTRELPWSPRALHYTVAFAGKLWVMGGQTMPQFAPAPEAFYRDVWCSEDGKVWQRIEPAEGGWPARGMIGGSAVFRGRIWILGGGTYDTPEQPDRQFRNDVWSSADGASWTCHTTRAPWAPRQYHEVAVFDDRLWVLEGYGEDGQNRSDVWWSSDGIDWHEVPDTPWAARHAASVFVHDDALWIVAGNNMESDVWKLVRH